MTELFKLNDIDLSSYLELITTEIRQGYFNDKAGQEHYRLLAYISISKNNESLIDIGTLKGDSALALAYNKSNSVISFDILDCGIGITDCPANIKFIIGDVMNDEYVDLLKSSSFILVDTAHDGIFEREFYEHLSKINWRGILMMDDIILNDDMKELWAWIDRKKIDMTDVGHWSGTGFVVFDY